MSSIITSSSAGLASSPSGPQPGELWAWGQMGYTDPGGTYYHWQGLNTKQVNPITSPTQVGTLNNWVQVSTTTTYVASKANTSAGVNSYNDGFWWGGTKLGGKFSYLYGMRRIGVNPSYSSQLRSSPTLIDGSSNWSKILSGNYTSLALKTDGTLWSWGYNGQGQMGQNNTINGYSPIQVGTLNEWKEISNSTSSFAIKNNGTLWAWGKNTYGSLGLGDTVNRSSPVQVGSDSNWKEIRSENKFTLALKTDGTLWSWGSGSLGYLGSGNTISRSSPVQIGTDTSWTKLLWAGANGAIKNSDELWMWGRNTFGVLGDGTEIEKSSPVQIPGSWINASSSYRTGYISSGIKSDGSLWGWGHYGNSLTRKLPSVVGADKSSPTLIDNANTWLRTYVGSKGGFAIK